MAAWRFRHSAAIALRHLYLFSAVYGPENSLATTFSADRLDGAVARAACSDRTGAGRESTARLVLACIL